MARLWDGHALKRSYKDGVARFNAYLEDYALFAGSLIDLYEASLEGRYLELARTMADAILERFLDAEKGGFFFTSADHERLITRSKAVFDGSTPSGNSAAVIALLRLHGYTGEERYFVEARRTLSLLRSFVEQQPFAFSHMLEAIDLYQRGASGNRDCGRARAAGLDEWIERLGLLYLPNRALFLADPRASAGGFVPEPLRGKSQVGGRLTGLRVPRADLHRADNVVRRAQRRARR